MIDAFEHPEGATPISDYSFLKLPWIHTQQDLNRAEAENIALAQKKYLNPPIQNPSKWFEPTVLKKIHKDMYGTVWEWAGKYRKEITSIGIKPYLIPTRLAELCKEVKCWLTEPVELTFVEQAARIHHKLVLIHPFENGNGRFSRLVADRYLMVRGCSCPMWPVEIHKNGSLRDKYILALKIADQGDYQSLTNFMRNLGVKDISLTYMLNGSLLKNTFSPLQRLAYVKAYLRMGYPINDSDNMENHPMQLALKNGYHEIASVLKDHLECCLSPQ